MCHEGTLAQIDTGLEVDDRIRPPHPLADVQAVQNPSLTKFEHLSASLCGFCADKFNLPGTPDESHGQNDLSQEVCEFGIQGNKRSWVDTAYCCSVDRSELYDPPLVQVAVPLGRSTRSRPTAYPGQ
jgi:hypothetical protein